MGVFITGTLPTTRRTPRWSFAVVTPAVVIVSSSIANPTVITTATPHGFMSGDTVLVAGHTGSTPAVDGSRVVTVLTPTSFSVPVSVSVAGSGGTATLTTAVPVIALADAKLHARLSATDTTEDGLVASWTRAATQQVEHDTGVRLRTQTIDLVGDAFPYGTDWVRLPFGPVPSVVSLTSYDASAVLQTMAAADYILDTVSIPARIALADGDSWPTDLRTFQPIALRVIAGYPTLTAIPEALLLAVQKAIAWHSMHREPTVLEKQDYDWLIGPYQAVVVA